MIMASKREKAPAKRMAFLKEHLDEAIGRAKALKEFQNPSSGIYKLIEMLGDSLK